MIFYDLKNTENNILTLYEIDPDGIYKSRYIFKL